MENIKYFLYLIGETITPVDIINDAIEYFEMQDKNQLKYIHLIILHTLVTFENSLEIEEELKNIFIKVDAFLVPATQYEVMRNIIRHFDGPSTIIKILGGSWTNAAAILAEAKYSKIYVFNSLFKTQEYESLENFIKNNDLGPLELSCILCNNPIIKIRIDDYYMIYQKRCVPICTNPCCINYLSDSPSYANSSDILKVLGFQNSDLIEIRELNKNKSIKMTVDEVSSEIRIDGKEIKSSTEVERELEVEHRKVPEDWNLRCVQCGTTIDNWYIKRDNRSENFFSCYNPNCVNFNKATIPYMDAIEGMKCWKCSLPIKRCSVKVDTIKNEIELRPYCDECKETRERIVKILKF